MRRTLFFSIIFLLITVTGCGQGSTSSQKENVNSPPDFRNVSWGMSMSDVQKSEKEAMSPKKIGNSLWYKIEVNGKLFSLSYDFVDDKLYGASYFAYGFVVDNSYINDYNSLKSMLIEKYGKPTLDKMEWKNENIISKNDPSNYWFAVAQGDLIYAAQWETPKTIVGIILSGDNKTLNTLLVTYDSKEYKKLAEDKEKEKI